jgi:RNA polymerase sigma factor (sigma-70 family)
MKRRPYVVAFVVGTALTALGPVAQTRADAREATTRTITDMSRYCSTCWRNAALPVDCWSDCTQEVFQRLLERVAPDSWGKALGGDGVERQEFVRAIDTVKKRCQRSRKYVPAPIDSVADRHEPEERRRREERQVVDQAAEEVLSARQQRILRLSFEGWSVQEIAQELDVSAERVSDEKYKAIRKLREHLHSGLSSSV